MYILRGIKRFSCVIFLTRIEKIYFFLHFFCLQHQIPFFQRKKNPHMKRISMASMNKIHCLVPWFNFEMSNFGNWIPNIVSTLWNRFISEHYKVFTNNISLLLPQYKHLVSNSVSNQSYLIDLAQVKWVVCDQLNSSQLNN